MFDIPDYAAGNMAKSEMVDLSKSEGLEYSQEIFLFGLATFAGGEVGVQGDRCFGKRVLMLHIVATCIAKSQLQGNCSGLRIFGIGYSPRIVMSQDEEWASSSATSIGTEENSLGVPKASDRALIYMEVETT